MLGAQLHQEPSIFQHTRTETQVLPASGRCLGLNPLPGKGCGYTFSNLGGGLFLIRVWSPWAHRLPLVSSDVRLVTLSCCCSPQAASAAV